MSKFVDNYIKLLITQYADKPKALATLDLLLGELATVYEGSNEVGAIFDVDTATGNQLDIIGKIVGFDKSVPFLVQKNAFGFFGQVNAYPMAGKDTETVTYPYRDKFGNKQTPGEIDDVNHRFFIKAQIAKNYARATMTSDDGMSLQNAIGYMTNGNAYVTDNKDMSMDLYVNDSFDLTVLEYMQELDLIPRPQGVRIKTIIRIALGSTFGFKGGISSTWRDKNSPHIESYFARKVFP